LSKEIQIQTHHFLKRDMGSKAIINHDLTTKRLLQEKKRIAMKHEEAERQREQEIISLKSIVKDLQSDMHCIKECLHTIATKV